MLDANNLQGLVKKNYTSGAATIQRLLSLLFYRLSRSKFVASIRKHARLIASTYDVFAVIIAWLIAYWILIDAMADVSVIFQIFKDSLTNGTDKLANSLFLISVYSKQVMFGLMVMLPFQYWLFKSVGLYRGFWRFASTKDLQKILYVSLCGGLGAWIVLQINSTALFTELFGSSLTPFDDTLTHTHFFMPRYVIALLYTVFLAAFLSAARFLARFAKDYRYLYQDSKRVIIVGAGNAGEGLVRDLLRDNSHSFKPIIFLDDDTRKLGREIHGIRVAGSVAELPKLITMFKIDLVLIAIPSASAANMRCVVKACEEAKVPCYTLPGLKDLANGRVTINSLRNISLEDLLGRYPVTCQWELISKQLQRKTVLVTGGGGSIGSELCRQIATLGKVAKLIIVDNNEFNLYAIDMELRQRFPNFIIQPVLLSVTDRVGIQAVLKMYQPHMVFHAAAYKHVPLLENQARIAIFNNVIGTKILAEESAQAGVGIFVLISTDKAVNPTNVMGATKRSAEYFCQNFNAETHTRFITVRFGNVLDSAGSVVPLFRKQIEAGAAVTVTHPEITRFFMTIPEASQLILQAAFQGEGGEIFVLDMGEPIKIRYLAEQMIKLAGKAVDKDIKIIYTGLRPGEKLYEEYFYPDEALQPTSHSKILRAKSSSRDFSEIKNICEEMTACYQAPESDIGSMLFLLKRLVPEYQPRSDEPVTFEIIDSANASALEPALSASV